MKEEWKDKLQNSLADYEESAPEGLWNDIDKALSVGGINASKKDRKNNKTRTIVIGFLSAAACTAALVGIFWNGSENGNGGTSPLAESPKNQFGNAAANPSVTKSYAHAIGNSHQKILAVAVQTSRNIHVMTDRKASITADKNMSETTDKLLTSQEKDAILGSEGLSEVTENNGEKQKASLSRSPSRHTSERTGYIAETGNRKLNGNKLTASIFASNSMSNGGSQTAMVMTASNNTMLFSMPSEGEKDMTAYYVGKSENESVKHHQPVKMGFSIKYNVTPRIGVETGLTYSYLSSDIKQGTDENCVLTQQKLHFIGIPLNVIYSFWKNRWADAYVSAGGMAEKNIKGKSSTEYMLDNKQLSEESNKLKMKELQWSANIAAGLQFNVSKEIGIYIEPGIGYYIDNGSSLKTAYSEKPFNFNLKFGLRYSFE